MRGKYYRTLCCFLLWFGQSTCFFIPLEGGLVTNELEMKTYRMWKKRIKLYLIIKHMCYTSSYVIQLLIDPIHFSNVLFPSFLYFSVFLFVIIVLYYICMYNVYTVVKAYGKLIIPTFNFNLFLGSKWILCQTNIINCVLGGSIINTI